MNESIKRKIRPLVLPLLHRWQYFYDVSRGKWREFTLRGAWTDFRDRRKILKQATPILEDVYGFRFVLYPWDEPRLLYLYRHPHDLAEFQAVPRLVKPGCVALDIGANIGFYSVLLSRLCGPTGRVWAFEPVPETHWRLRETLALNRCENVTPIQGAVGEKSGTACMNLFDDKHSEWNTLGKPAVRIAYAKTVSPSKSIEVPSLSLDTFCEAEAIQRIHFMKVDVEGFELSVFQGAKRLLGEGLVDCICFEISKEPLKGAGVESRAVFEVLETYGYLVYRYNLKSKNFEGPIQDTAANWTNFYASRTDLSLRSELIGTER